MFKKYIIKKLDMPVHGNAYNVQEWTSTDGKNFYYCGFGRFCKTQEEAKEYIKNQEA